MAVAVASMTDEQRKAIAFEYFRRFDRGGDVLELFDDNADMCYPKWGIAQGKENIGRLFADLAPMFTAITHNLESLKFYVDGDVVVVEGTTAGVMSDGREWRGGVSPGGRWCDVMEIRDFKIQRVFVYLDPDYASQDLERYHWNRDGHRPSDVY